MVTHPIVRYPDPKRQFILTTDAAIGTGLETTTGGLGAVLSQYDDKGQEYVIAYASRTLKSFEKNYSAFLLELTAACYGIEYFSIYLCHNLFILRMDHKPLEKMSTKQSRTHNRLQLLLMTYNFNIEFKPGSQNCVADFCSRHAEINALQQGQNNIKSWCGYSRSEIVKLQRADPFLGQLIDFLTKSKMPSKQFATYILKSFSKQSFLSNDGGH